MLIDDLKQLKLQSKLTNQEIANRSGVPLATVNRIMSGQTDNPSYQTVIDMIIVMGGNTDPFQKSKEDPKREAIKEVYHLLKLFGERYIFCDNNQAIFDCHCNREDIVESFSAILSMVQEHKNNL